MGVVQWDKMGESKKGSGGGGKGKKNVAYLKVETGGKYKVRPVGQGIEITKVFNKHDGRIRCVVIDHTTDEGQEAIDKLKSDYGLECNKKYIINVIDRADGQLKVYEGPKSVFEVFGEWKKESKVEPGSKDGVDFSISAKGDGKERRYMTMPLSPAPFTDAEKTMIKEKVIAGDHNLEELYKATPTDKIEEYLFGNASGASNSGSTAKSGAATAAVDDEDIKF